MEGKSNDDVVFRTKTENKAEPEKIPSGKTPAVTPQTDTVEVPYTSYEVEKKHPYSVDYFKLGDNWDVFEEEVNVIESYLRNKVINGTLADSQTAIKDELMNLEKLNNLQNEERAVVKTGVLASYIKFIRKSELVKRLYGNY